MRVHFHVYAKIIIAFHGRKNRHAWLIWQARANADIHPLALNNKPNETYFASVIYFAEACGNGAIRAEETKVNI